VLSRSAEYAVRALSLLAIHGEENSLHSREIADRLGLPPQFLTKILRRLTPTGLVASQRGRSGGFRLGREPGAISLLDVVTPFEEPHTRVACLLGQEYCSDEDACPLHAPLVEFRTRFYDLLETTTLEDIAYRAVRTPPNGDGIAEVSGSRRALEDPESTFGGS
jgi:Rrf2 family protein